MGGQVSKDLFDIDKSGTVLSTLFLALKTSQPLLGLESVSRLLAAQLFEFLVSFKNLPWGFLEL